MARADAPSQCSIGAVHTDSFSNGAQLWRVALTDGATVDGSWLVLLRRDSYRKRSVNAAEADALGTIVVGGLFDHHLDSGMPVSNLARFAQSDMQASLKAGCPLSTAASTTSPSIPPA